MSHRHAREGRIRTTAPNRSGKAWLEALRDDLQRQLDADRTRARATPPRPARPAPPRPPCPIYPTCRTNHMETR